ncbi:hypothetical protein COHA_005873 [Chlorella ohadii]|uniref:Uncharacterized protein n=1 Tax=Chlorella ohadii TaxID=2649997 RepID=A0AAD5DMQ8_9CHLO|nr:hypothetical protein COHA_005873 [Chlorella ohadii]
MVDKGEGAACGCSLACLPCVSTLFHDSRGLWLAVMHPDKPIDDARPAAPVCLPSPFKTGRGHIINLGSVAGLKGVGDEGAYSASKWALRGWSNSCYESLKDKGVKVVLIEPSHIATDMAREQEGTRYSRMDPGLMIQPEDVAQAALLAFRLGPTADPVELVLNRLQTPYQE